MNAKSDPRYGKSQPKMWQRAIGAVGVMVGAMLIAYPLLGAGPMQVVFGTLQVAGAVGGVVAIMGGLAGGDQKMCGLGGFFAACSLLCGLVGMSMVGGPDQRGSAGQVIVTYSVPGGSCRTVKGVKGVNGGGDGGDATICGEGVAIGGAGGSGSAPR